MIYTQRKQDPTTRIVGIAVAVLAVGGLVAGFANAFLIPPDSKTQDIQVAIIEEKPPEPDEPPPPPPPTEVILTPPMSQVILPDIPIELPPPPTAVQQVVAVERPVQPPKAPPATNPTPAPATYIASRPVAGARFERDRPPYPEQSRIRREEGNAVVAACVDASGKINSVTLVQSSGSKRLDDATVKGLKGVKFDQPAKDNTGKPVAMCDPPYQFTLEWKLK